MKEKLTQEQFESIMYQLNGIDDFSDDMKEWDGEMYVTGDGERGGNILDRLTEQQKIEIIENFIGNFPEVRKYYYFTGEVV